MFSSFESGIEANKSDEELSDEVILVDENKKRKISEQNLNVKLLKTCDNTQNEKQKLGRHSTSLIRKYFKINEKLQIANCEIDNCNKIVKNACTTNLKSHAKTHHLKFLKVIENEETKLKSNKISSNLKQQTFPNILNKNQKYNHFEQKRVNNEKALAYFFAASRYPYNMIKNDVFRNLLTQLDLKFNIPGLTKLTNHAIKLENSMHEKIKDLLLNTSSVALTTDWWTTKNLINSYLCLTTHFYNENIKSFVNILLGLQVINENHLGENIKLYIEKILKTYNLPIKSITRIVTDNGSNMIKTLKVLNQIEYQNSINSMEKVIDEVASGKLFTIDNCKSLDNIDNDTHWENEIKEMEIEIINFEIEDQEINTEFSNFAKFLPCYAHTLQLDVNVILKSKSIRSIADKVTLIS
jgi:hypothetical protein